MMMAAIVFCGERNVQMILKMHSGTEKFSQLRRVIDHLLLKPL